jgi:hypothetical protein
MEPITKTFLRKALSVDTDAALAQFFGISASAVSQWPEDRPIPEIRQLQLEKRRPDLFAEPDAQRPSGAEAA